MNQNENLITESASQPLPRVFPTKESNLSKILSDPQYRKVFHARLKKYNPLIAGLYRVGILPLFGISRSVMLLITRGRKSGKLRFTPIGYFPINGINSCIFCLGKEYRLV